MREGGREGRTEAKSSSPPDTSVEPQDSIQELPSLPRAHQGSHPHPTAPPHPGDPTRPRMPGPGGSQPSPRGQDEATSKAKLPACLLENAWGKHCAFDSAG